MFGKWTGSGPRFARSIVLGCPPDSLWAMLVRTAGLEPASPYGQKILSLQRLPVPPRPHGAYVLPDRRERNYSAASPFKFSRSRISLPGLK
jgi:hypothetical protein